MIYAIIATLVLSTLDGVLTLYGINKGWYVEVNPLLGYALSISPTIFMALKTFLVSGSLLVFWTKRDLWLARAGVYCALAVYVVINVWHGYLLLKVL